MMEVNRLNPTKSIRIEGISHFAFVNGWLLRSWGGVDVSQAVCRKRASAPVAQPPLLAPTVPRVDRDLSAAATGIRARRHGAARGEQPPECTSLKQTGLAYGCGDPCLSRGGGAGFRVRGRCQAVACDIGGNGTLCRRGRCDLLRRSYCENEKGPIVGALRVRWDSKRISFWSCDRFHATASAPGSSGL